MGMYRFNIFSTFLILDITLTVRINKLSLRVVLICKLLPFFCFQFLKLAHTKCVSKKEAFILSIAVFLKILWKFLEKLRLFGFERASKWEYTFNFLEMVYSKSSSVTTLKHATQGYKNLLRISNLNISTFYWKLLFVLEKSHFNFKLLVFKIRFNLFQLWHDNIFQSF